MLQRSSLGPALVARRVTPDENTDDESRCSAASASNRLGGCKLRHFRPARSAARLPVLLVGSIGHG